jgi:C-terminal processing protease CtpA/Prc
MFKSKDIQLLVHLAFQLKAVVIRVNKMFNKITLTYFSFSTGFPVLISRVTDTNAHLLHIGDAILKINNEDISDLTHDQVINKLHGAPGEQVNITVKYMNDMATYLHLTSSKLKSAESMTRNSMTIPRTSSTKHRQDLHRLSAEYPSECHTKRQLSMTSIDQEKVRTIRY